MFECLAKFNLVNITCNVSIAIILPHFENVDVCRPVRKTGYCI